MGKGVNMTAEKLTFKEIMLIILIAINLTLTIASFKIPNNTSNDKTPQATEKYQATILEQIAYDAYIVTLKKDDKLHYYILFTQTYDNLYVSQKIIVVIMDNDFVVPYVEYIDNIIDGFKWCDYFDRNNEQGGVGWCMVR